MKKQRQHYAPEGKVSILRRHLLEKEPISKLCDEVGLQPAVFSRWPSPPPFCRIPAKFCQFFTNGFVDFTNRFV